MDYLLENESRGDFSGKKNLVEIIHLRFLSIEGIYGIILATWKVCSLVIMQKNFKINQRSEQVCKNLH